MWSLLHSVDLKAVDNNFIVSQMSQKTKVQQNQNTNQRNWTKQFLKFCRSFQFYSKFQRFQLFFIDRSSKSSLPRWPQGLLPLRALSGRRLGRWATTSWRSTPARRSTSTIGLNSNPCWPPNRGKRIRISSRRSKFQVSGWHFNDVIVKSRGTITALVKSDWTQCCWREGWSFP